jgi:DNA-binding transcriptional ArsR family regulator
MTTEENADFLEPGENIRKDLDLIGIDYNKLQVVIKLFRALNNKQRQLIIEKIRAKKKINVTELVDSLAMDQSAVSQQLAILRDAGIVSACNDGRFVFYKVNNARLNDINTQIKHFLRR